MERIFRASSDAVVKEAGAAYIEYVYVFTRQKEQSDSRVHCLFVTTVGGDLNDYGRLPSESRTSEGNGRLPLAGLTTDEESLVKISVIASKFDPTSMDKGGGGRMFTDLRVVASQVGRVIERGHGEKPTRPGERSR